MERTQSNGPFRCNSLPFEEFTARFADFVIVMEQEHDFLIQPMMAGPSHMQMRKGVE